MVNNIYINQKDWENALEHTHEMIKMASDLPDNCGFFYIKGCKQFLKRYLDGERTNELYEDMINLH